MPYDKGNGDNPGTHSDCPTSCYDNDNFNKRIFVSDYAELNSPEETKQDIMNNGPVQTSFTVYEDFRH